MSHKHGDVVQLKSGGAPMTVTNVHSDGVLVLTAISTGGLLSETMVHPAAVEMYFGKRTPATKDGPVSTGRWAP